MLEDQRQPVSEPAGEPQPPTARGVRHGAADDVSRGLTSARPDPPGVVAWLADTGDERRAAVVLEMQRTAGNRAVTRFLAEAPILARKTGTGPGTVPGIGTGTGTGPAPGMPHSGPWQRYAPTPGSRGAFEQSWRDFWSSEDTLTPLATLEPGPAKPPFVSEIPPSPSIGMPGRSEYPQYETALRSGRRLHVLEAIEHGVATARDIGDLEQVLRDYLDYTPANIMDPEQLFSELQPQTRHKRVRYVTPPGFDPDGRRMTVFHAALMKRPTLKARMEAAREALKGKTKTELASRPKTKDGKSVEVVLWLPSTKAIHRDHYAWLASRRRLVHRLPYERGNPAQDKKWKDELQPGAAEGMHPSTYARGEELNLTRDRILLPDWSRDHKRQPMNVDHIVELQVVPRDEHTGLWNSVVNYELLDGISNSLSGSQLKNNIIEERLRLARETGDETWLVRELVFDRVETDSGPRGSRWKREEIRSGEHLDAWAEHLGERSPGNGRSQN
jgi:hypothetical protein